MFSSTFLFIRLSFSFLYLYISVSSSLHLPIPLSLAIHAIALHVDNRRDSFATKVLLANEEAVERIGTGAGTRYVQEDLNRLVALTLHHHPCSSTSSKLAPHSPNLPFILS